MIPNRPYSKRCLLVATPIETLGSANTRTVHLVRNLAPRFGETFVISRPLAAARSRWSALLRTRTEVRSEGTTHWLALFPWGHVRDGLGLHLLGLATPYAVPGSWFRRKLRGLLSSFGAILEAGLFPSLVAAYATRIRRRVDVFIGEGPWEILLGLLLRSLGLARIVVYDDIDYQPGFQPVSGLRRRMTAALERFGVRRADLVISVGNRLARLRRQQGAEKAWVIPNGVDWERFNAAVELRAVRPPSGATLIYTGYLGSWSGIEMLLEVTALLAREVPGLRLILLGHAAAPEMELLQRHIGSRGLEQIVEFRGMVPYEELPPHLAAATLGAILFPPLQVTQFAFPLKVVEYMAAGLPVVTTAQTEAADLVSRADAGVVVPYEARAAAQAISKFLRDRERQRRCAENALSFSRAFDWKRLMEAHAGLIERCLDGRLHQAAPEEEEALAADPGRPEEAPSNGLRPGS